MLHRLHCALDRRRLRDPAYAFLFDAPHPDEVVAFDCETSGLDPSTAEILSLGAVRIRGNRVLASQRLEMVIKPQRAINAEAIKVHRLRQVDVDHGLPVREAMARFLRFIGTRPLVGYFLEFDVAMVNAVIRPWLGIRLPQRTTEVSALYYDHVTGKRSRDALYTGHVDLRFETIRQALDLPPLPAHDAFNDALMAGLMFIKLREARHRRL